jgi:hypothetical protein
MSRSRLVAALTSVMLLTAGLTGGLTGGLAAADPAAPTAQQRQQAQELTKKGIAKGKTGDFEAAIDLYLQAYNILPEPMLLSNIGAAYQQANKPADAVTYFCKYVAADPAGVNAGYAIEQVRALRVILGTGVDADADACKPPEKPKPVEIKPVDEPVKPVIVPPPPPPPVDHGRGLRTTGLVVGGVGLLAVVGGVYFGIQGQHNNDLVANHKIGDPWPANIADIEAEGHRDNQLQVGLLVVGGAAVVGGVVCYVLGRGHHAAEAVAVVPRLTDRDAGLALVGRF